MIQIAINNTEKLLYSFFFFIVDIFLIILFDDAFAFHKQIYSVNDKITTIQLYIYTYIYIYIHIHIRRRVCHRIVHICVTGLYILYNLRSPNVTEDAMRNVRCRLAARVATFSTCILDGKIFDSHKRLVSSN